ncbi:MAG: PorT family protein [Prevotellaceae bacterium]|jgi:hypothetical protein|nr:PorT family protein [Prevotellaceae bacterium]
MKRKSIILAVAGVLACSALSAQEKMSKHEVSAWGAGGLSTLNYSPEVGDSKKGGGGPFGIGYNYHLSTQWSIGSGVELSFYNAKTEIDNLSDAYAANDGQYDFEFRTVVSNYEEKQKATFLNIPLTVKYQTMGKYKFYASGGIKLGIPISSKYEIEKSTLKNTGYYPQWNIELTNQEFMGFGSFTRKDIKDDLDLKFSCMLTVEAGMKWNLQKSFSLYSGIFFDYGLNNITKYNGKHLVAYNTDNPEQFRMNGALLSEITSGINSVKLVDKVVPMVLGLKIQIAYRFH